MRSYYWKKRTTDIWNATERPFPKECEYLMADVLEKLRPKAAVFESLDEAQEAVDTIEQEYKDKVQELLMKNRNAPADAQAQQLDLEE